MPRRIQLSRIKGFRLPRGAVAVSRPGKWGNPFILGKHGSAAQCVEKYRAWLEECLRVDPAGTKDELAKLRGKDLACWCPLDQPCHADVLLELANR